MTKPSEHWAWQIGSDLAARIECASDEEAHDQLLVGEVFAESFPEEFEKVISKQYHSNEAPLGASSEPDFWPHYLDGDDPTQSLLLTRQDIILFRELSRLTSEHSSRPRTPLWSRLSNQQELPLMELAHPHFSRLDSSCPSIRSTPSRTPANTPPQTPPQTPRSVVSRCPSPRSPESQQTNVYSGSTHLECQRLLIAGQPTSFGCCSPVDWSAADEEVHEIASRSAGGVQSHRSEDALRGADKVKLLLSKVLAGLEVKDTASNSRYRDALSFSHRERVKSAMRIRPTSQQELVRRRGKAVPSEAHFAVLSLLRELFHGYRFQDRDVQVTVARPGRGLAAEGSPACSNRHGFPRFEAVILGPASPLSKCCQSTVLIFFDVEYGLAELCTKAGCPQPALRLERIDEVTRLQIWGRWTRLNAGLLPRHNPPRPLQAATAPALPPDSDNPLCCITQLSSRSPTPSMHPSGLTPYMLNHMISIGAEDQETTGRFLYEDSDDAVAELQAAEVARGEDAEQLETEVMVQHETEEPVDQTEQHYREEHQQDTVEDGRILDGDQETQDEQGPQQEEEEQEEQAEESDDAEARDQEEHSQDTAKYGQPLKRDQEKQEEQEEEKDEGESAAKAHDQDVNSEKMQALILAGLCEEEILKVQLEEFQRKVSGDSDQSLFSGRRLPMSSRRNSNREGRPLCARKFGTGNRNSTEGDEVKAVDVVRDVQHDATDAIYLDDRIEGDSAKDSLLHEVRPDYFVEHGQVATMVETLTLPAGRSDMSLKQSRALSAAKNSKACASLVPALTVSVGRTCGSSHHLCVQDVPSARMQRRSMSPGPAAPSSFQGTHSSLLSMGGSIVPDDRPDDSLDSERSFVNSLRQARSPALPAGSALAVARRCVSKPKKAAGGAHSFGRDRPRWRILPPKIAHRRGNAAFQLPSALVVAEPDRRPLSARVG
eukprot:TRINITY_DN5760_c0_g1_i2.p1 TRINITY_DN5760_c0_g1~~TRINITY_DN5760_c0_g1_i2.p1  ORF type:complete len:942 (+),score=141.87 TRINITY_DN5760_c0_g1_i2:108-2933(+)